MSVDHLGPLLASLLVGGALVVGVWLAAYADGIIATRVARDRRRFSPSAPLRHAALLLTQQQTITERPDITLWRLAPAAYGAMAALVVVPVPFAHGLAVADVRTGIVVLGTAEVLAMVAIYLNGWSSNSYPSLIGGYRILAMGLSYVLIGMFVLIAAALPAESLSVGAIVESQRSLWNVVRQPLGLPLWLIVGLGVSFWGPLDLPDGVELGRGTASEVAGGHRLAWELSRYAMLVAYAIAGAAVFLGGYLGPFLPGWLWMAVKSAVLVVLLVSSRHLVARIPPERFVASVWTILLPVAFLNLGIAGLEALP